jgi:hypothetical protein
VHGRVVFALSLSAAVLAPRRALAGDLLDGSHDLGFVRAEGFATVGAVPALALNGDDTPRRVVGAPAPSSSVIWHGVGAAFAVRANFLTWDIASIRYSAADSTFGGASTANGEPLGVSVGALRSLEIGVPLCGIPSGFQAFLGPRSQWKLAFALEAGFDHLWATADVSTPPGGRASGASISDWSGYLRFNASTCGALGRWTGDDPVAWLCLSVSPKLVDGNGSSGVSVGARIEL